MSCPSCDGWVLFRPVCSPVEERPTHRCRCLDSPMEKVAWAFTWVGWFVAAKNRLNTPFPHDPREA
jgi:hypothetical protein